MPDTNKAARKPLTLMVLIALLTLISCSESTPTTIETDVPSDAAEMSAQQTTADYCESDNKHRYTASVEFFMLASALLDFQPQPSNQFLEIDCGKVSPLFASCMKGVQQGSTDADFFCRGLFFAPSLYSFRLENPSHFMQLISRETDCIANTTPYALFDCSATLPEKELLLIQQTAAQPTSRADVIMHISSIEEHLMSYLDKGRVLTRRELEAAEYLLTLYLVFDAYVYDGDSQIATKATGLRDISIKFSYFRPHYAGDDWVFAVAKARLAKIVP